MLAFEYFEKQKLCCRIDSLEDENRLLDKQRIMNIYLNEIHNNNFIDLSENENNKLYFVSIDTVSSICYRRFLNLGILQNEKYYIN